MQITNINTTYAWQGDRLIVTQHEDSDYSEGNSVETVQNRFYQIHIYDKRGQIQLFQILGNQIDLRI